MDHFISGTVAALRDLWIIGDKFLFDIFPTLPELKSQAVDTGNEVKAKLYFYEYFNVFCFTANPLSINNSPLARIYNSLLKGLNESVKLPRVVMFVLDGDLIESIDYHTSGKSHVIDSSWQWLVSNVEKAIAVKKEELKDKQPGLIAVNEPKTLWVKMIGIPDLLSQDFSIANDWKHQLLLLPVTHSGVGSTSVLVSGWNSKLLAHLEVRIV